MMLFYLLLLLVSLEGLHRHMVSMECEAITETHIVLSIHEDGCDAHSHNNNGPHRQTRMYCGTHIMPQFYFNLNFGDYFRRTMVPSFECFHMLAPRPH